MKCGAGGRGFWLQEQKGSECPLVSFLREVPGALLPFFFRILDLKDAALVIVQGL